MSKEAMNTSPELPPTEIDLSQPPSRSRRWGAGFFVALLIVVGGIFYLGTGAVVVTTVAGY